MLTVLEFITLLRSDTLIHNDEDISACSIITEIFTNGNCGNLALLLTKVFGGKIYSIKDRYHIIAKIDNEYYDITGRLKNIDESLIEQVTENWLYENDFVHNYSFPDRGPAI